MGEIWLLMFSPDFELKKFGSGIWLISSFLNFGFDFRLVWVWLV